MFRYVTILKRLLNVVNETDVLPKLKYDIEFLWNKILHLCLNIKYWEAEV